jgi:hypothetical protein
VYFLKNMANTTNPQFNDPGVTGGRLRHRNRRQYTWPALQPSSSPRHKAAAMAGY